ncbi:uncharacterized protein BYT42DRAFT_38462 [Radiomyces spectabilis]|uniref:uncharacterized protein n=1 Tax=Radiomyces spectabilis TaxID=64574 RepID=UPI0022204961|nr:uncharacterized protein BYT42DRAFT_38462 [Radiomyces spectabilis]KAI8394276.1 hypothetical protein BYT42DRAFT_38462 [Radiomyces spectabilis]
MNFNFEGNYKPRRNINLGGVRTQTDKQALMAKAQSERKLRERERLRLRGATKIQSFYRGRKVAAALHDRQRIEFGDSISQIASLTRSSELDVFLRIIIKSTRLLLMFFDVQCPTDCAQALQLIHALLQRWQMQDTVFIHLFLQYDEDEEIDSTLWLFKLLIKKVLLPLALTEESDYTCPALHLLSTIMDPDVYASIESKDAAFSSHEVFVSIITYCTLNTRLFHVMRHLLLSFNIPPERCHAVTTILSHLLSAQPPFTYHSAILSRYPLPTPSAMGLFSYTPSKSTRTPPSKHTEISQQLLAEKLVIHILTVPFLMDRMPKDDITQILRHVTLDTIFNTVVVSYNNEEWKDYMNPDSIALLLVNLNQMIPIQSDFSPSIYTDAVQLLLAALPSIYFVDPEHQSADKMRMMYSDSDDDSDEEDVAMIESIKVDDGITSRLFSLYDKESMDDHDPLAIQEGHDSEQLTVSSLANR